LPFAFISFKDITTLNPNTVTVSGLSSGAMMASQMLVNSSSKIQGAGAIAGAPFYCAEGSLIQAFQCIGNPETLTVDRLVKVTRDLEKDNSVDPLSNLQNRYVFLLNGKKDQTVKPGNGPKSLTYFKNFIPLANIKTEFSLNAGHSMPTVNRGNACDTEEAPWVNSCNYDTVQNMLEFLLHRSLVPSAVNSAHLYQIDLGKHVEAGSDINTTGLVYVPDNCKKSPDKEDSQTAPCDLHIVFHGCRQTLDEAGLDFIKLAGYNDWAENNNIVVFYPNILKTMENPKGCWDWWGYSSPNYNNNQAPQSITVLNLIKELTTK
ncbi:MAG: extracellular catalytic domain type 2 short-chain-length polyhydroxyalkanoate depolymerase, partial [Pseudobdellovibrio sp.]